MCVCTYLCLCVFVHVGVYLRELSASFQCSTSVKYPQLCASLQSDGWYLLSTPICQPLPFPHQPPSTSCSAIVSDYNPLLVCVYLLPLKTDHFLPSLLAISVWPSGPISSSLESLYSCLALGEQVEGWWSHMISDD